MLLRLASLALALFCLITLVLTRIDFLSPYTTFPSNFDAGNPHDASALNSCPCLNPFTECKKDSCVCRPGFSGANCQTCKYGMIAWKDDIPACLPPGICQAGHDWQCKQSPHQFCNRDGKCQCRKGFSMVNNRCVCEGQEAFDGQSMPICLIEGECIPGQDRLCDQFPYQFCNSNGKCECISGYIEERGRCMCHHHELITKEGRPVCLEQGHCAIDSHCAPPAMLPFVFCNKHPGAEAGKCKCRPNFTGQDCSICLGEKSSTDGVPHCQLEAQLQASYKEGVGESSGEQSEIMDDTEL